MKQVFWIVLAFLGTFNFGFSQQPAWPDSIFIIQDSVLIPTRSGVDISATVVRKKTSVGPLPTILFYTTYYQGPGDVNIGKRVSDRDYVAIVAYARGIRTDLSEYVPYLHESTDIYDIIDWISRQEWSDGSVGMYGGSYSGFSQWATVKNTHPALKTIVPQVAVMPGFDTPMENNVPLMLGLYWPNDNIYHREQFRRSLPFEWFESGVSFRSMDSLAGEKNEIFQNWLRHPAYDSYWKSMVPTEEEYSKINIPILTTTGYYDGSQLGAIQYLKMHLKSNPEAEHYFVIGPYDHWGGQRRPVKNLMGYQIDPVADVSMLELAYQWLDFILKGKPKPELLQDKMNYQVMGTNEWKHSPNFENINNDTLIFYLSKKTLTHIKPEKEFFESQTVDFKDRKNEHNFYTPEIIFDSLDVSGGLIYMSQPFDQAFEMNGSFSGNLFATINKRDMDVSLALYELKDDGKYFFLTRYLGRASYSRDNMARTLLNPDQKESIPVENTRFVSKQILKGSRLVAFLNINKHPFEIINYGSGKEVSDETILDAGEPLQIKWHNDSYIKIPVRKE